jgi:hypothetical protein
MTCAACDPAGVNIHEGSFTCAVPPADASPCLATLLYMRSSMEKSVGKNMSAVPAFTRYVLWSIVFPPTLQSSVQIISVVTGRLCLDPILWNLRSPEASIQKNRTYRCCRQRCILSGYPCLRKLIKICSENAMERTGLYKRVQQHHALCGEKDRILSIMSPCHITHYIWQSRRK